MIVVVDDLIILELWNKKLTSNVTTHIIAKLVVLGFSSVDFQF